MSMTGRPKEQVDLIRDYYKAQKLFGIPRKGEVDYTKVIELDLDSIVPSVSGPRRPQDRIDLPRLKDEFTAMLTKPVEKSGYGLPASELSRRVPVQRVRLRGARQRWREQVQRRSQERNLEREGNGDQPAGHRSRRGANGKDRSGVELGHGRS
jgi:aconitate hydratase